MAENTVLLDIQANTRDAASQIEALSGKLGSMGKTVALATGAYAALQVGIALAGKAISSLNGVMSEAIDSASSAQDATNELNQAMALNGQYSRAASADMAAFAAQMQATTKFSDDQITSQLALAQSFGKSNEQTKQLVTAATELSAATGVDLNTAVETLGRTYTGTSGTLGRSLPVIKGLTEAQLKHGDAIKIVLDRFGGSAAAQVNTFSGALTQTKNSYDDLLETIGDFIVKNPYVIAAIKDASAFFGSLQTILTNNKTAIGGFVSALAKLASQAFPKLLSVVATAIRVFATWRAVLTTFVAPIAVLISKIAQLLGIVDKSLDMQSTFDDIKATSEAWLDQADAIDKVAKSLGEVVKKNKAVADSVPVGAAGMTEPKNGAPMGAAPKDYTTQNIEALTNLFSGMANGAAGAATSLSSIAGTITNVLLPGFGTAVEGFLNLVSKTPEDFKASIKGFFDGLADVVHNIVTNMSTLSTELLKGVANAAPEIIVQMIKDAPKVITEMVTRVPEIIEALVNGIAKALQDLFHWLVGENSIIADIGDWLGLAKGGTITGQVPAGYQNDTFPAMLTSGETVVDRNLTDRLNAFLSDKNNQGQAQNVSIVLQVGEEQLSRVLVNLNRQGFRTA